jgi:hypothetical protein
MTLRIALGCILALAGCGEDSKPAPATVKQPPARTAPKADVPTVDAKVAPHAQQGPMVVVTGEAILFDGESLVKLDGGQVAAADKEGGAHGMMISRLAALLKKIPPAGKAFHIAATPTAHYGTFSAIAFTAARAGYTRPLILVNTKAGPADLAVAVPEATPSGAAGDLGMQIGMVREGESPPEPPPDAPAKLIISLTGEKLLLWSISGREGTLQAPALELAVTGGAVDLAALRAALEGIVDRRWPGKRPLGTDEIIVQAGEAVTMQTVAGVIASVQMRADGRPLFPVTLLAVGF